MCLPVNKYFHPSSPRLWEEQSEAPWLYGLFTLLSASERSEWGARSLPVLSATEECGLGAFPRRSTWGWGGDRSLMPAGSSLCHPAPGALRHCWWWAKPAEKGRLLLMYFYEKVQGDLKSQAPKSQFKDKMFFASCGKRDHEEGDGEGLSNKSRLQLLLSFVLQSVRKKLLF